MEKRYINLHAFDYTDDDLIALIEINREYSKSGAYEIIVDDKFWENITVAAITFEDEFAEKPLVLTLYGNDYDLMGKDWEPVAKALGWECFEDTFLNEYDTSEYAAESALNTWIEDVAEVKLAEDEE
jgi:hypothetical protein